MRVLAVLWTAVTVVVPLSAQAIDVYGDQWGTWTRENSPYNVIGQVRVPPESSLVIEPGVLVNFQGHYKFIVDSLATLLAIGTETDSIYFTTEDTATGWHGIRLMYSDSSSQISYCRLEHGKATGDWPDNCGGAIYCYYCSPMIQHNSITSNWAEQSGGGIYSDEDSSPTISYNTMTGNSAYRRGGGIFCYYSDAIVSNNNISWNSAGECGGGIVCRHSDATISSNTVSGNSAWVGGGIFCWDHCSSVISGNTIDANSAGEGGGGICCSASSPTIRSNTISRNSAPEGGGIACTVDSSPVITNNEISHNRALGSYGGGISCFRSRPTINNNTISGNSARSRGGGIHCFDLSHLTIQGNTISRNSAESTGGGVSCFNYSTLSVTNTILWGDTAPDGMEIYVSSTSNATVTYCDVQGGWPGQGNIDCDPLFRDPENGDFQITWENYPVPDSTKSCCIDAGGPPRS